MSPVRKQRRSGILIVIAVLVVVCAFWTAFLLRSPTFGTYRREMQLKRVLTEIKPPSQAKVLTITTSHQSDLVFGTGSYVIDSSPDKVKAHYIEEFRQHGFDYRGEDATEESQISLEFCAPDYFATLVYSKPSQLQPLTYLIFVYRKDTPCWIR